MKGKRIYYNPKLTSLARKLRNNSTKSEIILWKHLKGKQMHGYDFHRQKPIDKYIVDFFCYKLMLAIELDGLSHGDEESHIKDIKRDARLKVLGIKVLRFENKEVYYQIENVLSTIECYILELERIHPRPRTDLHTPSS